MQRNESCVILTSSNQKEHVQNRYRLIQTVDCAYGTDVYSIFMTTMENGYYDEEFAYDIARDFGTAKEFFARICKNNVTSSTLLDVARDLLAE